MDAKTCKHYYCKTTMNFLTCGISVLLLVFTVWRVLLIFLWLVIITGHVRACLQFARSCALQNINDACAVIRPTSQSAFAREQTENPLGSWRSCHRIDHDAAIFTCRPSMPLAGVRSFRSIYSTPSPDGRLVVCSKCVLFERVLAWRKLCGFHLPSSTAQHLIPDFMDYTDFGVATVELTNKLFDDAEQLIRNVPARPKCYKGIYELLFTEEDFQSFQLSLTCKCAYCVKSVHGWNPNSAVQHIPAQCSRQFSDVYKPNRQLRSTSDEYVAVHILTSSWKHTWCPRWCKLTLGWFLQHVWHVAR